MAGRRRGSRARLVVLIACAVAASCERPPERVYVPDSEFEHRVSIRTEQGRSATVAVGEALVLHGRRTTGPWRQLAGADLPEGACWVADPGEAIELEVAANLRWRVEPEGAARFNVDFRSDLTREVTFSEPGTYRLFAESSFFCAEPFEAGPLTVVVSGP